jgi:hypothetical protein
LRQFDVFENPNVRSRAIAPLIVILQSHLLADLPTIVVAPLLRAADRPLYTRVSVEISLDDTLYLVLG